ncbi:MAG: hypothetical protein HOM11_14810 [Methylococcales bacterium]|jgi:hypothetical protein|nr:hypothetical protein [Methylococcales bacterium]MBT7443662.1 hypothetical protein [Methylococcales bacterium]
MKIAPLACLLSGILVTTSSFAGSVYRCGKPGEYVFSNIPCDFESKELELNVAPPSGDPNPYEGAIKDYLQDRADKAEAKKARLAKRAEADESFAKPRTRGLSLRDFSKVDFGMSEAEIILLFGQPDQESVDSVNTEIGVTRKSYYYVKTGFNANVSRIIFTNGSVSNKTRDLVKNSRR